MTEQLPQPPDLPDYSDIQMYPDDPAPTPRGSKLLYVIGALLIVVGVIGAIVAGVHGYTAATDAVVRNHSFASGDTTVVHLEAGRPKVVYIDTAGRSAADCHLAGAPAAELHMVPYDSDLTINQWKALFTISADEEDDYSLTCTAGGDSSFTVGDDTSTDFTAIRAGVAAGGLVALTGVIALFVTAVRRRLKSGAG
ncbi:putative membrane protein [Mycobacterium sp. MAA66]|uniref:hypothetical protein n=1 Tax=Mycobacterium sp. MAA66 TaxID=3156297 RepID=UPI003516549F